MKLEFRKSWLDSLIVSVPALAVLFTALAPQSSWAWGDLGHQTVGEIADRFLTPHTKKSVEAILGPEPLASAAIFPDNVRSDRRFNDFAPYHYVEILPGYTYETRPEETRAERDSNTVIEQFPAIIRSKTASRTEKMLAIRYLVHVVGDVHQPLHTGNGIDLGGNLCQVEVLNPFTGKLNTTNLHTVWDEDIVDFIKESQREEDIRRSAARGEPPAKRFFGYAEFATRILKNRADLVAARVGIESMTPVQWYNESVALRQQSVYPDEEAGLTGSVKDTERTYCGVKKEFDPKNKHRVTAKPRLGRTYLEAKVPLIEAQILKGGLRLAALLNQIFADAPAPSVEEEAKSILPKLLLKSR